MRLSRRRLLTQRSIRLSTSEMLCCTLIEGIHEDDLCDEHNVTLLLPTFSLEHTPQCLGSDTLGFVAFANTLKIGLNESHWTNGCPESNSNWDRFYFPRAEPPGSAREVLAMGLNQFLAALALLSANQFQK